MTTMTDGEEEEEEEGKKSKLSVELKEKIDLTENEREILDRLLGTLRFCNLDAQLRAAGGWVRDKLLGRESGDIEIAAIDNMSASEFLDKLKEYLSSRDEGDTVIGRNPELSRHLETAKMRLYDQWIDFVALRCDEYTVKSRIPARKFGTAKEDAYIRDFTINSLFYSLNTGSVEDLTERGINDLKSGRSVTPLPAKATFLDDPLRVLRAIRFGARFGFALDEELKQAASNDEVRVALGEKISRERIGNEIDSMLSGNGPVSAVTHISDLKLFEVVFAFPSSSEPAPSQNYGSICQAYLEAMWSLIQTPGLGKFSDEQRRLALYASLFLPFRKIVYEDKGKLIPVVNYLFKFYMKRKTSDAETVMNIHRTSERFLSLIPSLYLRNNVQLDMLNCGNDVIEHWKSSYFDDPEVPETLKTRLLTDFLLRDIKSLWRVAALLTSQEIGHLDFQLDKLRGSYLNIEKTIRELGLDSIWEEKPKVNDSEIIQIAEISREHTESPVCEEEPLQRRLASDDKQMEVGEKDQESEEVMMISGITSSPVNPVSCNDSEIVPLFQSPLLPNDIRRLHCHLLHCFLLISLVPGIFGGEDQNAGEEGEMEHANVFIAEAERYSLLPD